VQKHTEVPVYGVVQMMSAAGGTLGMYLGISLFSVTSFAVDWLYAGHCAKPDKRGKTNLRAKSQSSK
jgi:hypothetical protein